MAKWMTNLSKMTISVGLGFEMGFCFQNQGAKRSREQQNRSKHSDCCSKIDFAHLTTSAKESSWLGSNLVSKSINFPSQFETKNTSEANFIFCCNFGLQNHPKFDENPLQNAWSELRISTLGHFGQIKPGSWSQGHLQGPSSCSFWRHMDLIWSQFSSCSACSYIISRAAFVCKVQFTVRITGFTAHNLQISAQPCNHRSFSSHSRRTFSRISADVLVFKAHTHIWTHICTANQ